MLLDTALHPDFRIEIEAQLAALCAAYPEVDLGAVRLFRKYADDRSLGSVEGSDILLNAYWFAQPREKLAAAALLGREAAPYGTPLWHGGMTEAEHLIAHEFGHLLSSATPGAGEFAKAGHAAALADPAIAVSGYALVDPDEWFSETFAGMRLGAPSPQVGEMEAFLAAEPR